MNRTRDGERSPWRMSRYPKLAHERRRMIVAIADSGVGGFKACEILLREMHAVRPIKPLIVCSFGEGTYGRMGPTELRRATRELLQTAQDSGASFMVMACNTASMVINDPQVRRGIHIPVVNLVHTMQQMLMQHERVGARPCVLCTPAVAGSPLYGSDVAHLSQGRVVPTPQGVDGWAAMINNLDHLKADHEIAARVQRSIAEAVRDIPHDASSVVLGCTHFPAIQAQIHAELTRQGKGPLRVIDPMQAQAIRASQMLAALPEPDRHAPRVINDAHPVVLHTAPNEATTRMIDIQPMRIPSRRTVEAAAQAWIPGEPIVLHVERLGTPAAARSAAPYLFERV